MVMMAIMRKILANGNATLNDDTNDDEVMLV